MTDDTGGTIRYTAGRNAPLPAATVTFTVSCDIALDLSVLITDAQLQAQSPADVVFYNRPVTPGVRLTTGGIDITPAAIRPDAAAALCLASLDPEGAGIGTTFGRLDTALRGPDGTELAVFSIDCRSGESAMICWELYRRDDRWKVRAVGQGYTAGLAGALVEHGVPVEATPATGSDPTATPTIELPDPERLELILEDAARSSYSYLTSVDFAATRLDEELSAALADPADRIGPRAVAARESAQLRHDELVSQARRRYDQDCAQLGAELREVERTLPRGLADWSAPTWTGPVPDRRPAAGIRIGVLTAPERGSLRIPLCLRVPMTQGLWLLGPDVTDTTEVASAVIVRTLAARPGSIVDLVDLSGSLRTTIEGRLPQTGGITVTETNGITDYLESLAPMLELAIMDRADRPTVAPPVRLLVLNHFPYGYQPAHLTSIAALVRHGGTLGLSLVLVGAEPEPDDTAAQALADRCRMIPATGDTRWHDPWTSTTWTFTADRIPAGLPR
ncbi:TerD family protein [Skermania piniformis]|uniref:TerD family protein n=1 Tax=Skermania pinensis TaxID=39122 RepID=A0ABX8SDA7_9ACTN|nr:TerD family protein [Skermania piniformis]QXQ15132.1 TerD family protein [Skermania piniformis]